MLEFSFVFILGGTHLLAARVSLSSGLGHKHKLSLSQSAERICVIVAIGLSANRPDYVAA